MAFFVTAIINFKVEKQILISDKNLYLAAIRLDKIFS